MQKLGMSRSRSALAVTVAALLVLALSCKDDAERGGLEIKPYCTFSDGAPPSGGHAACHYQGEFEGSYVEGNPESTPAGAYVCSCAEEIEKSVKFAENCADALKLGCGVDAASANNDAGPLDQCEGDWAQECRSCYNFLESVREVTVVDGMCQCSDSTMQCFSTSVPEAMGSNIPALLIHEATGKVVGYPVTNFVPAGFKPCDGAQEAPAACGCGTGCEGTPTPEN